MKKFVLLGITFFGLSMYFIFGGPLSIFMGRLANMTNAYTGDMIAISGGTATGGAFLAGESVLVEVWGPNHYYATCVDDSVDENGVWNCQVTLQSGSAAGGNYTYRATGMTSGYQEQGTFYYPPEAIIYLSQHQGQSKVDGTLASWRSDNLTTFAEKDDINFQLNAVYQAGGEFSGDFQVRFTAQQPDCQFFDGTFELGGMDNTYPAVETVYGVAPVVDKIGEPFQDNQTGEWVQQLHISFSGNGEAIVYYHLRLSDQAGLCKGDLQHSRITVLSGISSTAEEVTIPALGVLELPNVIAAIVIDRDGNGSFESPASAGEFQFCLDGTTCLATDASGQVIFTDIATAGLHTITEQQLIVTEIPYEFVSGTGTNCTFSGDVASADVQAATASSITMCTFNLRAAAAPQLALEKTVLYASYNTVGQNISYKYSLHNTGNVTLSGPFKVFDDKISGVTCPASATSLAPDGYLLCSATYTVTQADLNAGSITNNAYATGSYQSETINSNTDTLTINASTQPELRIAKSATPGYYSTVGREITYQYTVTNNGNVTIGGPFIVHDDKLPGLVCYGAPASLVPGDSFTCTGIYTTTQADLDRGYVTNHAYVTGYFNTFTINSNTAEVTVNRGSNRDLSIKIAADPSTYKSKGQVIGYKYTITNTGEVTLGRPFALYDDKASDLGCSNVPETLAAGASFTCSGSYTITQGDLNNGSVTNHAYATAYFQGETITSSTKSATVKAEQETKLQISKSSDVDSFDAAGDKINYTYTVTNKGNVTLTAPFTVTDNRIASVDCSEAPDKLKPGESFTCSASYSITTSDIIAGQVTNEAAVSGKFNDKTVTSSVTRLTIQGTQVVSLTLEKTAEQTSFSGLGDSVDYKYTITNDGNVPIVAPFSVTDDKTTVDCSNAPGTLQPGESFTCHATYSIKQSDLNTGYVTNLAVAHGLFNSQVVDSDAASVTITGSQVASLHLQKTADPTTFEGAGDTIEYRYRITNDGSVTLSAPFTVSDDILGDFTCEDAPASLAPEDTFDCTISYTVTEADKEAEYITNTASVTALLGAAEITSNTDSATVTYKGAPPEVGLSLDLKINGKDQLIVLAGKTITYTYTVENIGQVTLDHIAITDTDEATEISDCSDLTLEPEQTATCEASTTALAGPHGNVATASTTYNGQPVSAEDSALYFGAKPSLLIKKYLSSDGEDWKEIGSAPGPAFAPDAGVYFKYEVQNTGNVGLDVSLADSDISLPGSCDPGVMAADTAFTCTVHIEQAGSLNYPNGYQVDHHNTATASATYTDDEGDSSSVSQSAESFLDVLPSISVKLTTETSGLFHSGSTTFTVEVSNLSKETAFLTSLVSERYGDLDGTGTCSTPQEIAGGEKYTCSFKEEFSGDAGVSHSDTITATASDDEGNQVSASDSGSVEYNDSLFTDGSYCSFDKDDALEGQQFRLIFNIQSNNARLVSTNSGLFAYNMVLEGAPGETVDTTIQVPYPFVTYGKDPVNIYDGFSFREDPNRECLSSAANISGNYDIASTSIELGNFDPQNLGSLVSVHITGNMPDTGILYVSINLEYGLLKSDGWTYGNGGTVTNGVVTLLSPQPYQFSFASGQTTQQLTVESVNKLQSLVGFLGTVQDTQGNPVRAVEVQILDAQQNELTTLQTDVDGYYEYAYNPDAAAEFTIKLPAYGLEKQVTLQPDSYIITDFTVPIP